MNAHVVGHVALLFEVGVRRGKTLELLVQHLLQAYTTAVADMADVILLHRRSIPLQLFLTVRRPWNTLGLLYPWQSLLLPFSFPREPIDRQQPAAQLSILSEVEFYEVSPIPFQTLKRGRHWTARSRTLRHREGFETENSIFPAVGTDPSTALRAQRLRGLVGLAGGLRALCYAPLGFWM